MNRLTVCGVRMERDFIIAILLLAACVPLALRRMRARLSIMCLEMDELSDRIEKMWDKVKQPNGRE